MAGSETHGQSGYAGITRSAATAATTTGTAAHGPRETRDTLIAEIKAMGLLPEEEKAAIETVNMKYLQIQEKKLR